MLLTVKIDNVYEDGETITNTLYDVKVDAPTPDDALDIWAEDNLFPLTGTGRYAGNNAGEERTPDAAYFVKILAAEEKSLVGQTFEWGL